METRGFRLAGLSKSTCKTALNKGERSVGKAEPRFAREPIVFCVMAEQVSLFCFGAAVEKRLVSPSVCFQLPSNLRKIFTLENEKDNSPPPPLFQETSGLC